MKTYTIGRDLTCDIVIDDNTDVISRRHAVLKVADDGSMTITDISSNGTYINGIRMNSNEPVPVTRKDTVSFAHVSNLDWNSIPTPPKKKNPLLIGLISVIVIAIAGLVIWLCSKGSENQPNSENIAPNDTIVTSIDSITAPVDSINNGNVSADTLNTVKAKEEVAKPKDTKHKDKKDSSKDNNKEKQNPEPAKKDSTSVSKRAIG